MGPLEAKARAAEEGILLGRDLSLDKVIIKGDAKIIMSATRKLRPWVYPILNTEGNGRGEMQAASLQVKAGQTCPQKL